MKEQEFYQEIERLTKEILGESYTISLRQFWKTGCGWLDALMIKKENQDVMPTVYLQDYNTRFQKGEDVRRLAEKVVEDYKQAADEQEQVIGNSKLFNKKEQAEQNLFFRCVSSNGKNREVLAGLPHRKILNLSIIYSVLVNRGEEFLSSFTVTEDIRKHYGWTEHSMFQLSMKNTRRLFPEQIQSIEEILSGMSCPYGYRQNQEKWIEQSGIELIVVSNHSLFHGFSVIFYPGILSQLAEKKNGNLIILPASVHEALVFVDHGLMDPEELNRIITEVNNTMVAEKEQLSDRAYYYDRKTERFSFLENNREGGNGVCVKF